MDFGLLPQDQALLTQLLHAHLKPGEQVWVFGSRAKGTNRPYSDIDLAIEAAQSIEYSRIIALKDELVESDLNIRVDVVDYQTLNPTFKSLIVAHKKPYLLG